MSIVVREKAKWGQGAIVAGAGYRLKNSHDKKIERDVWVDVAANWH